MRDLDYAPYPPIEDHGAIGNLRTAALVARDGSIDWLCQPNVDSASVFCAILDHRRGGRFRVSPAGVRASEQRYIPATNVLETCIAGAGGVLRVTDLMPLRGSITGMDVPPVPEEVHRWVDCDEGNVTVEVEWSPRPGYALDAPHMAAADGAYSATHAAGRFELLGAPADAVIEADEFGPVLRARFRLARGERVLLVHRRGGNGPLDRAAAERSLQETVSAWREWAHRCPEDEDRCAFGGKWHDLVRRSSLVLKLLTHPDSGAIVAAPTTSLPEEIGGVRNWDYRFSWIRDAAFTSQALTSLGHRAEALDFLTFMSEICRKQLNAGHGPQILYGVHGETDVPEQTLDHLEGYCGSRPVRIGNAAATQLQHDVYGELLGAALELMRLGDELPSGITSFLAALANRAAVAWRYPDSGIWEVRNEPKHFVYSKVMVWVALDRAIRMSERFGMDGDVDRWRAARRRVCDAILTDGYDREVGAFVQSFGSRNLDAANLLIPIVGLLPFSDPRVQSTIDRTLEQLTRDGLVYRYDADDGVAGGEGAFLLTTFWMIDALALSGRVDEAEEMFEAMVARASPLGLYAEEVDPASGTMLGNFPQGFSHIGFINSALYLRRAAGREAPGPAPIGTRSFRQEMGHDPDAAA